MYQETALDEDVQDWLLLGRGRSLRLAFRETTVAKLKLQQSPAAVTQLGLSSALCTSESWISDKRM